MTATPRTIFTTCSGRGIDLLRPKAADVDFADVAEGLAKLARYAGATPGQVYSVAEHCCRGADAILAAGHAAFDHERIMSVEMAADIAASVRQLAAYFLLHDAHEYLVGDDTQPKLNAWVEVAREHYGSWVAQEIERTRALLIYRIDRAIHAAAGLPWPPSSAVQAEVRHMDLRMRETEWRDLIPHPKPWSEDVEPLPQTIGNGGPVKCWPWEMARTAYLTRCRRLLPRLLRQEGAA